eukprot:184902-Amphidinium_carterae.1
MSIYTPDWTCGLHQGKGTQCLKTVLPTIGAARSPAHVGCVAVAAATRNVVRALVGNVAAAAVVLWALLAADASGEQCALAAAAAAASGADVASGALQL